MISRWFVVVSVICVGRTQLLQSLQNVINYGFSQNVTDLNFLIGVAIAKGQMKVTSKYISNDNSSKKVLTNLLSKCEVLLKATSASRDSLSGVLSSHLWAQDVPVQPLSAFSFSLPSLDGSNPLSPILSDSCLRSAFTSCLVPSECIVTELSSMASGYALTHQVLYWTIFEQVCHSVNVRAVLRQKCHRVVTEHLDIFARGLPQLLDLYFEQVVVCGLHGFLPLSLVEDQQTLLSLQTSIGCFSLNKTEGQASCDIHLSGVAAGALSIMIKYNIKGQV